MDSLDSRVRDPKKRGLITSVVGQLTPSHCVVCTKVCGYVTEEGTGLVIAVCDECFFLHGSPPGLQQLWDEEVARYVSTGKHN